MIPFEWLIFLGMLAVAAILVAAILAVLGLGPDDHDGPWSLGAVLLVGLSMAPQFPAEQPMSAGRGGPWAATIARDGAAPEPVDFSGGVRRGASATRPDMWNQNLTARGELGPRVPWLLLGHPPGPTNGERGVRDARTGDCRPRSPLGVQDAGGLHIFPRSEG